MFIVINILIILFSLFQLKSLRCGCASRMGRCGCQCGGCQCGFSMGFVCGCVCGGCNCGHRNISHYGHIATYLLLIGCAGYDIFQQYMKPSTWVPILPARV